MISTFFQLVSVLAFGSVLACNSVSSSSVPAVPVAEPQATPNTMSKMVGDKQVAIFAGGCFWGVEAVFEHVNGVIDAKSGYSGGVAKTADYETVSGGKTGHAESVQVTFDPAKVSYEQLLEVFFKVAHDPTELNRQGPDTGTQYRSAIFFTSDEQKQAAISFIEKLNASGVYKQPIVTQVVPLEKFYDAEAYHQNYLPQNMDQAYIVINDLPKIEDLKKQFPALFVKK